MVRGSGAGTADRPPLAGMRRDPRHSRPAGAAPRHNPAVPGGTVEVRSGAVRDGCWNDLRPSVTPNRP